MPGPIFFSVCIPQYGRSRYLLMVLDSLRTQRYAHFEVVISDDCSKDDTAGVIPAYLKDSGLRYRFLRQELNLGYDANLRASLEMGEGDYLLILGNDDALVGEDALERLAEVLEKNGRPQVLISNYRLWRADGKGEIISRVPHTVLLPGGPGTATAHYRDFAFVAGIVFAREAFARANTPAYDHSIFVQVFLGCKIIAEGGHLLLWDGVLIDKDVEADGKVTFSYKDVERQKRRTLEPDSQGLASIAWVATEAVFPALSDSAERSRTVMRIYRPMLRFTYPYWLYAHRKEGFRRAAICMAWGCYPPILLRPTDHSAWATLRLMPAYVLSTLAGFLLPVTLIGRLVPWGHRLSKRLQRL
jgi:glycosyltransferase involved in cell wall biosynthesis